MDASAFVLSGEYPVSPPPLRLLQIIMILTVLIFPYHCWVSFSLITYTCIPT